MRYFLDTEFLDDGRVIELISLGVVAEDGRSFYAISSEMPLDRVLADDWLVKNVWPHIRDDWEHGNTLPRAEIARQLVEFVDTKHDVRAGYANLLPPDSPKTAEFWGWNCAYDWVVVRQLWGKMIDGPRALPNHCNDIKQWRSQLGVYELPRIATGDAHNALADAHEVKGMWEFLRAYEYKMS